MKTPKVILTSESVDKILWCDHSNETFSAVLSLGTIYILGCYKTNIWDSSWNLILATLGSERVKSFVLRSFSNNSEWLLALRDTSKVNG